MTVKNRFTYVFSETGIGFKNAHKHKELTAKKSSTYRTQGQRGHGFRTKAYSGSHKHHSVDGAYWLWGGMGSSDY